MENERIASTLAWGYKPEIDGFAFIDFSYSLTNPIVARPFFAISFSEPLGSVDQPLASVLTDVGPMPPGYDPRKIVDASRGRWLLPFEVPT